MTLESLHQTLSAELVAYATASITTARASYGEAATKATQLLHDQVATEPQHWSGLLALVGYTLEGGTNDAMIIQAARAMELIRASAQLTGVAAQTGWQQAYMTLANLDDATETDRLKAISICARTNLLRAHARMPEADFLNPMHVGMVLAGADCHGTDDITPFTKTLALEPIAAPALADGLADRWPQAGLLKELAKKRLQIQA